MKRQIPWVGLLLRVAAFMAGSAAAQMAYTQSDPTLTFAWGFPLAVALIVAIVKPDTITPALVLLMLLGWWFCGPTHSWWSTVSFAMLLATYHLCTAWASGTRIRTTATLSAIVGLLWRGLSFVGATGGAAALLLAAASWTAVPRGWGWVALASTGLCVLIVVTARLTRADHD